MRLFRLHRMEDESGVSGTGIVAQGVRFDDGTCALRWLTQHSSTAIYANAQTMMKIHGHNGKTRVGWLGPFGAGRACAALDVMENVQPLEYIPNRYSDGTPEELAEWNAGYKSLTDGDPEYDGSLGIH